MRRSTLVLAISCFMAWGMMGSSAKAQHPNYLLLRTPAASMPGNPSYGYYPGYGYAVQAPTYAYGWFGVHRRSHNVRHFGYQRNYTQWSSR